ncbi:hypothetical protein J7E91_16495 [Streptomyces sp. ISL-99]|uniref:SbcC/MukB-like Walker B domain-containing protein n=1 Tax=Streptomyces sp. ISL-99 TaxID=2819193 RepID=UPI001BE87E51|nr:SbcC/MukB-like Walker B domain-containing protein [Streptomyces sp. ISL-99]MBT2526981.1 hypothetical protein [Streptomyces sp. ISL-99]
MSVPDRWATRWHLIGAGVENVWHFPREVFDCPSGRWLVTATNGSGKTTLLEMLCPHLLDPTAQSLSSGKNRSTTLESLMKGGSTGRRRVGYLWLSFAPPKAGPEADKQAVHYGLRLAYTQGTTPPVERAGFRMPIVPGSDRDDLSVLSLEEFTQYVTDRGGVVFDRLDDYVTDLAEHVFGCAPNKLRQLVRRIKKVRNPGLLGELSSAQAEHELRGVLPRVSPEVLRVTQEALAAAEATRSRYVQAEKTAALLEDLSAAWLHACAHSMLGIVDDALERTTAQRGAQGEAQEAEAHARTWAQSYTELAAVVADLEVVVQQKRSRADALERDAASSDVARAREKADLCTTAHRQAEELVEVHRKAAAAGVERLEAAVAGVRGVVDSVARTCAEAGMPIPIITPVRLERVEETPLTIGKRRFGPLAQVTAHIDPAAVEETVACLEEARHRQHQRSEEAQLLVVAHQGVEAAQQGGREARAQADAAAGQAETARVRHQAASDHVRAQVIALSDAVQQWALKAQAGMRAPGFDLPAVVARARTWLEGEEFTGPVRDAAALSKRVTAGAATSAGRARERAEHYRQAAATARTAAAEAAECARAWAGGKLPALPGPVWAETVDESKAFAVAVDWRPDALAAGPSRNAVEAAMAATGLLSAELTPLGVAGHSGWLVQPHGPQLPEQDSLAAVLTVVPGHPLGGVAQAVLGRIGYASTAAETDTGSRADLMIGADGTYRAGPLVGRPPEAAPGKAPASSHVGVDARRAAARRAAVAAQRECDRFEQRAAGYARASGRFVQHAALLEALADQFPHELARAASDAEAARAESAASEQDARAHASAQDRMAQEKEGQFRSVRAQWREQAAAYGLPDTLVLVRAEAEEAARRADRLGGAADEMRRTTSLLHDVERAAQQAAQAQQHAERSAGAALASYRQLSDALAAWEACQQRSGMDELALVQEAVAARAAHAEVKQRLVEASKRLGEAHTSAAVAQQTKAGAVRRLHESRPRAETSLEAVNQCFALEGLNEALDWPQQHGAADDGDVVAWLGQLRARLAAVPRPRAGIDASADALRHHLAAAPGEDWSLGHGPAPGTMPTHLLSLGGRRMSPPVAAQIAAARQTEALKVYNEADEDALENFVLGQIPTAISTAWVDLQDWVDNVNDQMKLTTASSGVGVQIELALRRDLTPSIATIHHLTCKVGNADRTPEQHLRIGQELLAVMRLGEQDTIGDPGSPGSRRADRLAEAIDITTWVTVKYMITRPHTTKRERWGARDVTVSKGESRLIVLAPMLAALAAEYRDVPPHAARLCALDEVPGDVDDHGRDGIAAYIASLDLDLMSTSHNWDGSPGAWDGIDIFELEPAPENTVIAFPIRVYSPHLQHATDHAPPIVPGAAAQSLAGRS